MPQPIIDLEKCTGCGTCVETCPSGVLELKDGKAHVVNADDCLGCHACESVCPESAITVED
ncbi:MAG: 4Fe-4S binding protein [Thermoproteales archaeon]|nr:4Fe-4S binding protein [Thermoproteales archaeon]